ncbi:hypothetical protein ACF0H5_001352 [Mactra antiquata]
MSVAASRDARRTSITREIYRRKSRDLYIHRDSGTGLGPSLPSTGRIRRPSGPKPHHLKRYFATVPDADRKYLPVPKSFRKAQETPAKNGRLKVIFREVRKRFAIFDTIASYNFRENLVADLVAGLAVTGLHFPQGLAYALLAGLPPGIGMVSTLFPVLIYMFFGSAAHTSIGTNAIVSIIIGDMLLEPAAKDFMTAGLSLNAGNEMVTTVNSSDVTTNYSVGVTDVPDSSVDQAIYMERRIALVAGATFYTGIIFIVMALFRMGFLVTYLSQSFMSGFTTGVAVHIFSSQIKTALGLKLPPIEGVGKLVKLYFFVFKYITGVNIGDLVVTIVCVIILLLVKIGINERLKPKVPVPIDFILLVVATIISYLAKLPSKYGVHNLGTVELGIPAPTAPAFTPVGPLIIYAIQIGLVTFFLNISVIKIIARRNGYEINENIELNAYGMCNIIPAFFSNIPASVAPPRSALLSSMGAKTTMNAMSTFGIMLALVFYFGQFFESCPKAVLASMIMVAMKDLLKQVTVLPKLWKVNKNDFTTWLIAAAVTVFADIPYGLTFGVLVSLLSVINQSQRGWVSVIGKSDSEDLYLDAEDYGAIHEIPGVKIVRMESSLYFATAEKFRKSIYRIIEKDSDKYSKPEEEEGKEEDNQMLKDLKKDLDEQTSGLLSKRVYSESAMSAKHTLADTITEENENENDAPPKVEVPSEEHKTEENSHHNGHGQKANHHHHHHHHHHEHDHLSDGEEDESAFKIKTLVIDCIPINFIDGTGLDMLKMVIFELSCIDINVYLARCSRYMLHLLDKSDLYENFPKEHVFIDLPDAIDAALKSSKHPHEHKDHLLHMEDDSSARPSRARASVSTEYDDFIRRTSIFQNMV